jgi:hypothetical protein
MITVALTGPISAIRAKKPMKASAVQTTPRPTTDATTGMEGMVLGASRMPTGA